MWVDVSWSCRLARAGIEKHPSGMWQKCRSKPMKRVCCENPWLRQAQEEVLRILPLRREEPLSAAEGGSRRLQAPGTGRDVLQASPGTWM